MLLFFPHRDMVSVSREPTDSLWGLIRCQLGCVLSSARIHFQSHSGLGQNQLAAAWLRASAVAVCWRDTGLGVGMLPTWLLTSWGQRGGSLPPTKLEPYTVQRKASSLERLPWRRRKSAVTLAFKRKARKHEGPLASIHHTIYDPILQKQCLKWRLARVPMVEDKPIFKHWLWVSLDHCSSSAGRRRQLWVMTHGKWLMSSQIPEQLILHFPGSSKYRLLVLH